MRATVGSAQWVQEAFTPIWEESRKKFDDAIYRARTGEATTVKQLWAELAEAQEVTTDGRVAGLQCTGILNQLAQRGQIPKSW